MAVRGIGHTHTFHKRDEKKNKVTVPLLLPLPLFYVMLQCWTAFSSLHFEVISLLHRLTDRRDIKNTMTGDSNIHKIQDSKEFFFLMEQSETTIQIRNFIAVRLMYSGHKNWCGANLSQTCICCVCLAIYCRKKSYFISFYFIFVLEINLG